MRKNNKFVFVGLIMLVEFMLFACTRPPSNTNSETGMEEATLSEKSNIAPTSTPANVGQRIATNTGQDTQIGVFFMPSWNTSADPQVDVDSF